MQIVWPFSMISVSDEEKRKDLETEKVLKKWVEGLLQD